MPAPGIAVGADLSRISILGAGAEGCWLAARAARAGYRVTLEDLIPGKRRRAAEELEKQVGRAAGLVFPIAYAGSVEEAAREADLVIDFVPDELESKLEIFSLLDRMAPPHTIFATPSRTLSIADLASCTYRAEQCVSLRLEHAFKEQEADFRVEVRHAAGTMPQVISAVGGFWSSLGAEVAIQLDSTPLP